MNIFFIRHAESTNNTVLYFRKSLEERVADPPLSDLGHRQAQALGQFLAQNREDFAFDRIYISPFLRTLQTAAAFTHLYPDAPKIVWSGIHEYGGCIHIDPHTEERLGRPGMTRSQIQTQYPDYQLSAEITEEGWYFLPGYEPHETARSRAQHVMQTMIEQFGKTDKKIAFVSHWDFHIYFANAILGLDGSNRTRVAISNTGMSHYHYAEDIWADDKAHWWTLVSINRSEWLTKDLNRDWSKRPV
jgi:2,3-bisphosphoglycerate-dependent phosphoglycerate mutase